MGVEALSFHSPLSGIDSRCIRPLALPPFSPPASISDPSVQYCAYCTRGGVTCIQEVKGVREVVALLQQHRLYQARCVQN